MLASGWLKKVCSIFLETLTPLEDSVELIGELCHQVRRSVSSG
jgi:hypothetical protein